jgi:hypothetical protein
MLYMNLRVGFGWVTTGIWLISCIFFLYNDWVSAAGMKFNEWGDFLAGASAPLAFLWLVIGYFQQGEELGQNTKALKQQERALKLQVDELSQSVEQQKVAAIALGWQSKFAGLTARLDATNHMLASIERQRLQFVTRNGPDIAARKRVLATKQLEYEELLESVLNEIEQLVGEHRDSHE